MKAESISPTDIIKGGDLINHISTLSPIQRAEFLINHIEPYLRQGLNFDERPDLYEKRGEDFIPKSGTRRISIFKGKAYRIVVQRAAELFDSAVEDIEAGYEQYRYFVPQSVFQEYFGKETSLEIIQVISRKNAAHLWTAIKSEIDEGVSKYKRSGLPLTDFIKKQYEKYTQWELLAAPDNSNNFMYFCWRDYIKQYLESLSSERKRGRAKDLPALPDCFIKPQDMEILKDPRIADLYEVSGGRYKWTGSKVQLARFAHRLNNTNKLIPGLSSQKLSKIFGAFFDIQIDSNDEKAFSPGRVMTKPHDFDFIK